MEGNVGSWRGGEEELKKFLARAREERWEELAIAFADWQLRDERFPRERVFVFSARLGGVPAELLALASLTRLIFVDQGIGAEGAREIAKLDKLTTLDLSENSIGDEGAREIAKLTGLHTLDLSSNSIGDEGPREIAKLTGLHTLDLSGNEIGPEGTREIAKLAQLTSLDLWNNSIGPEGAREIAKLAQLTSLNLSSNSIGPEGAREIAKLAQLTSLNLNYNSIGPEGAREIAKLDKLTSLNLNYNSIGPEGATQIAKLAQLTSLNLDDNSIGAEGATQIAKLDKLTALNLWNNSIGPEGAREIAKLDKLTTLNLWNNSIGAEGAREIAKLAQLTSLNLSSNSIGAEGAREFAKLAQLTNLDLRFSSIGAEGAREIAKLAQLTSLDLWGNSIGDEGAREIAKLDKLTSLILNDNSIGAEGAREIAKLAQLTSLSLSSNSIGAEGAREIAKLAQLTSLDLWSNSIGDEGAREIARLDKLTSLNLNHNSIGPEGAREIAKLAQLTSLNLSSNSIGDKGAAALLDTIGETFGVRRLTRLHLHGNGITNIPEDILNRADAAAIVAYWVERKSGVPLHEAKVLLLGDGESGKTHVRHRVFGGTPRYVERTHVMTHGISRTDDEFECELQGVMERVRVRAWDFGGQRTLHGSHRFFMTRERSLYVLVLDATKSLAANHGRTWLRMIRHHSHHGVQDHRLVAPMMIVLTKCDRAVEHRVDALAREAMTAAEEIGCRVVGEAHRLGWMPAEGGAALTGEARDAERRHEEAVVRLRDAIAQVIPEVVGLLTQGFSRVVSGIMEGIESRFDPEATTTPGSNEDARKQIGWDVFTEMFTSSGSSADYARIVGTVFRSLGIVHFVTDDEIVRDTRGTTSLIFNPMWLKGPVYTLLRTPSEAHKGGMISPENVATVMRPDAPYGTDDPDEKASLWRRLSFTADDRARVIDLMRSCEIVFDVEERGNVRGSIIVPDLLQTSEGKGPPHSITAKGEIRLEYLPTNLLARLMGRWNDRLVRDRSCSVYDAQFSSGDRRLRARVRTDTEESVIQVDIWAGEDGKERAPAKEDAEHFYRAIADEVREIAPTRRDGGQADVVPGPLQMPYRMTTGGKAGLIALAAVSLIAGTVLAVLWHGDQRTEGFVVRTLFGVGVACLAMLAPWERFVVSIPLTGWKLRLPMGAVAFLVVFVFGTPNMLGGVRGVLEAIGQLILKK